MTEDLLSATASRPSLPEPRRERWQPLRLGLVNLFHYDSEEFWFHDGHLLLRGNNGTGKSKVLSLSLPLLFDAQLRSSRVEPDGDSGKKMAWNLLLGSHQRRIGYSWVEFGRRGSDGVAHYLTLGVGLSAVAGRAQVDSWFFLVEGDGIEAGPRMGQDLWLTTAQRQVLTRERLREALVGKGQVFENNSQGYRRAVDERLFHLGTRRYDALMDTLIQLRQPQLSKKPDETGLSNALSESLPPLPGELLADVAEALNQLEEDRNQLEEARRLEQAIVQFERRYRVYASMLARRQARELRQAQTGFDKASEARNRAQATREEKLAAESAATREHEAAKQRLIAANERVDTLQSDPANQDANRLNQAEDDANQRRRDAEAAADKGTEARKTLQRETRRSQERSEQAEQARGDLESARTHALAAAGAVGLDAEVVTNPLLAWANETLAETPPDARAATDALRSAASQRRRDLAHLRQRHVELDRYRVTLKSARDNEKIVRDEVSEVLERRDDADLKAERTADVLADAWADYCAGLLQLRFDDVEPLQLLGAWTARPEGDNPAQAALSVARQDALQRYALKYAELQTRRDNLHGQRADLTAERERLLAGEDSVPPAPIARAFGVRTDRIGAPLWRLVDFRPQVQPAVRAGVEAALEASGLLDAWLSPDGSLTDGEGQRFLDADWQQRGPVADGNLNDVLIPALPDECPLTENVLAALLGGVAYGSHDPIDVETWLSPDGCYRLGALAGAWRKSEARYIGHSARERARRQRLEEIDNAVAALDTMDEELDQRYATLGSERQQAEREWLAAPSDRPLHDAIAAATLAGQEFGRAHRRLQLIEIQCREVEASLQAARDQLRRDAIDLRLPSEAEALHALEQALEYFDEVRTELTQAVREWQRAWPEHLEQRQREDAAGKTLEQTEQALALTQQEAERAQVRFETLQQSIGRKVEELQRNLADARRVRDQAEQEVDARGKELNTAGKEFAVASTNAEQAEQRLEERSAERRTAADHLRRFIDSGLLTSALPDLDLPDHWSVDPALNLARRIEQALAQIADDEAAWTRVQRQIAEDLSDLQRGLSALGHQAVSEPNDWGITVSIQYQNRAERPDTLARLLAEDVAQRSELLSAKEREVLENHLQAEIAAEIQRLMRAADERVVAINVELHKRPTSTGVRYRLQWEPLSVQEGAPAGLEAARQRLLHTSADLWSTQDRRTVGVMLQEQIAAERARADAETAGSSLIDQLSRALDYRHWHRFRIQRQQDGQWRKLSGPASSGERALGLTVPLFAAIASFYGHTGNPLAPRLMLLDEAFAGIDDTARAHCMGLVREFDLDFVITSEREWACYAELPGVAICQLQRREGIDAVFVSRWTWDGRAKRIEDDPDRRFPLT